MAATATTITVKLNFLEECHRFTVAPEAVTLELIYTKVKEFYHLEEPSYSLSYRDPDGDRLTISTAAELEDVISEQLATPKPTIRIYVASKCNQGLNRSSASSETGWDIDPVAPTSVSGMARARFGNEFSEQEILNILRDISLFISGRDLNPEILSSVASEKNLITPQSLTSLDIGPVNTILASKGDGDKGVNTNETVPTNDVGNWNADKVGEWLTSVGYGDYVAAVQDNHITGDVLLLLDDANLKDLGIQSVGLRVKLLQEIRKLKEPRLLHTLSHRRVSGTSVPSSG
ncbi:hypothetical protein IWQ62_001738 [Dispira parvispora]|uniref:SAM domain-containing protein n=1 Tax=Dispira parvispora TaxID=1520584 RepID=A0A9W8AXM8_9FUNG|nr:hypothetical protein IWQ62_001738 [Dispira parvispora]